MKGMRLHHPVPATCWVFDVSASGYYAWVNRLPSKRARQEAKLEVEIQAAHRRTRETCGAERLQRYLSGGEGHFPFFLRKQL